MLRGRAANDPLLEIVEHTESHSHLYKPEKRTAPRVPPITKAAWSEYQDYQRLKIKLKKNRKISYLSEQQQAQIRADMAEILASLKSGETFEPDTGEVHIPPDNPYKKRPFSDDFNKTLLTLDDATAYAAWRVVKNGGPILGRFQP